MIEQEDGVAVEPVSRGRCEVAVQWEGPEGQCRDVGVQSQTQRSDAAVQVDLIGLSFVTGSDVPWRCVSVRAEEPGGGALWRCCLHSPLTPSDALLCHEKTPTKTPETTLPSMQHYSPSLGLPSMPICGDSPSSLSSNALERPEPPRQAPDALDAADATDAADAPDAAPEVTPEATPNTAAATGPPDAEVPEAKAPEAEAPEAALEALGFMAPLSSDEEGAALPGHDEPSSGADPPVKRRRGRPRTAPRIFSSPESRARRRNINARRAGLPLRYQLDYDLASHDHAAANQRKGPFLPHHKRSPDAGESAELRNNARPKQEEDDLRIDPGFERFRPHPLPPNDERSKRRLAKLKKSKNKTLKEEPVDDALDSARRDWPRVKKIKTERDKAASKKAPDWSKYQRFVVKQEAKRGPGRPRKIIKQEEFEIQVEAERDFTSETDSAERSYQLGSEDPDARGSGFPGDLEPGEVPDWFGDVKMEEFETEWANEMDESLEGGSEARVSGRIKLGDVFGGGVDGERGLVKKVKILNSDNGEQWENGYGDVQSLFVLRGAEDANGVEPGRFREGPDGEVRRRKRRRRRGESREETQPDPTRRAGFLVYRDEDTGRTEFISPCYVKLQPLNE